jgi:hypothetical protein
MTVKMGWMVSAFAFQWWNETALYRGNARESVSSQEFNLRPLMRFSRTGDIGPLLGFIRLGELECGVWRWNFMSEMIIKKWVHRCHAKHIEMLWFRDLE